MAGGVTQQQLDGLGARFDKGFDEIKALMRSFDDRMRAIELQEASTHPLLTSQIITVRTQQEADKKEIEAIRNLISSQDEMFNELNSSIKSIQAIVSTITSWGKWIAGIASSLIVAGLIFFIGRLIYFSITGATP